jgi:hypothetical protein
VTALWLVHGDTRRSTRSPSSRLALERVGQATAAARLTVVLSPELHALFTFVNPPRPPELDGLQLRNEPRDAGDI